MAGFYGADVEQLRLLAQQLERSAQELDGAVRVLGQQVMTTTQWQGRDAEAFRSQWSGSHRVAIGSASGGLRLAAEALRRNAADQETASRAVGGGGAPGRAGSGVGTGGVGVPGADGVVPIDLGSLAEPLRGMELPNGMNVWEVLQLAGKAAGVDAVTLLGDLQTVGGTLDSILDGDLSLYEATDAMAALMQKAPLLTPLHLGGNAIAIWTEVARLSEEADFSADGINTVIDYVSEDPMRAVRDAIDANVAYAPKLANMVMDIFR